MKFNIKKIILTISIGLAGANSFAFTQLNCTAESPLQYVQKVEFSHNGNEGSYEAKIADSSVNIGFKQVDVKSNLKNIETFQFQSIGGEFSIDSEILVVKTSNLIFPEVKSRLPSCPNKHSRVLCEPLPKAEVVHNYKLFYSTFGSSNVFNCKI